MDEVQNKAPEVSNTPAPAPAPAAKNNNTKWLIIIVVVLVALYALQSMFSPVRFASRMSEKAIESATGGQYKVDVDKDGSNVKITSKDGNGGTISSGENVSLPNNWPTSIPLTADANVVFAGSSGASESGTGLTSSYTTTQSPAEVSAFYMQTLTSNGWKVQTTATSPQGSVVTATKGENESVGVYIGASSDGKTTVTITTQIPK